MYEFAVHMTQTELMYMTWVLFFYTVTNLRDVYKFLKSMAAFALDIFQLFLVYISVYLFIDMVRIYLFG